VKGMVASAAAETTVLSYIDKMSLAFAASDLVVSRSGSTVSEILACGLPSILVPYPHAASNHQEHNARSLERAGAARVILDRDLNVRALVQAIDEIMSNESIRRQMSECSQSIARPTAQETIAQRLLKLIPT
jgi:UDP-N-acetylglucosamine--N-acetylmuramyl-(pentapeptide) pyrophosphoryl-undecaprenol N-acetylglucosamine transferase